MPARQADRFYGDPQRFSESSSHACSRTIYTLARHRGRIYHGLAAIPARSYDKSL
jgi:hypothetical protein